MFERIKSLDTQIKAQANKVLQERSKLLYRSEPEYDTEIGRLESEMGKVTLVKERENVKRIEYLRHEKKSLNFVKELEQRHEDLKAKKAQEKSQLDDPESRQYRAEMDRIQERMDTARKQQSSSYDKLKQIRDELKEAKDFQNKQYARIRKIKDDHFGLKRQYQAYEKEASRQRDQRRREEREKLFQEKQQELLDQRLDEARLPAYYEEIRAAESLIRLVNPRALPEEQAATTSDLAAQPQRTVNAAGMKGTVVSKKKDDEAYFIGGNSKKAKKDRKGRSDDSPAPESAKVLGRLLTQRPLEQLSFLEIAPPSSEEDLGRVLQQLLVKHAFFLNDRDRKTKEVSFFVLF